MIDKTCQYFKNFKFFYLILKIAILHLYYIFYNLLSFYIIIK